MLSALLNAQPGNGDSDLLKTLQAKVANAQTAQVRCQFSASFNGAPFTGVPCLTVSVPVISMGSRPYRMCARLRRDARDCLEFIACSACIQLCL